MKVLKNHYNLFLIIISTLTIAPVLAPILMYINLYGIANIIYFLYSFTCHQFDSRSLHLFDYQFAWCARDTAIWLSFTLTSWYIKFRNIKPISFYWLIPFIVPIALDGILQTIFTMFGTSNKDLVDTGMPLYVSSNLTRFLTGAIMGIGLALFISPFIKNSIPSSFVKLRTISLTELCILFLIIFLVYITFIQLWGLSSNKYKPEGYFDMISRQPEKDFFLRRGHAICAQNPLSDNSLSRNIIDLFDFDCFF
jgi:uncharacterized membrane protein